MQDSYVDMADDFVISRPYPWRIMTYLAQWIKPGQRVLDWGCGHGRFYQAIADKQVDYWGFDNCKPLLEKAQAQYPNAHWCAEEKNIPNQFDIIVALASWQHLPSRHLRYEYLRRWEEQLTSGGYLLLTSWNLGSRRYWRQWLKNNLVNWLRGWEWNDMQVPWRAGGKVLWRYYHYITKRELSGYIEKMSFSIELLDYFKQDKKSDWQRGENLVLVAKKL